MGMWSFGALCDEFYVNSRLFFKLDLEPTRDTVVSLFDQLRRRFPRMSRLRRRDDGSVVLDEEARDEGGRRSVRVDPVALRFGFSSPPNLQAVADFGKAVLVQAPVNLSLSELDYDYLEVTYGFDLEYRGNHDELVAETLLGEMPLVAALMRSGERMIDCQPFFGVALGEDCATQAYVEVKGRTSTFEVRSGEFEPASISVYLTVRRYWGTGETRDLAAVHKDLLTIGESYASERAVPLVVKPLAAAIASQR
jgi:hypothetical protein